MYRFIPGLRLSTPSATQRGRGMQLSDGPREDEAAITAPWAQEVALRS